MTLRAQVSTITSFYESIATLLKDGLGPKINVWAHAISTADGQIQRGQDPGTLGGVTASAYFRDLLYRNMVQPQRVRMFFYGASSH